MPPRFRHHLLWYRDETVFLGFKQACVDEENFAEGYEGWLRRAEAIIAEAQQNGIYLRKVEGDPHEFRHWCKVNACAPDTRARSRYAGIKGAENASRDN